ncbi:hypothetical protein [Pseudomonas citronellolis]|uniref:hypothetical protein n=1 Tax=Pseudomonas citronellolis TaxID=53408 RepID=UPI0023E401B5|nr:hypothetical protein [Pseudomonas citronellolis]MDF3936053.1 hypothetical protein [Pseudomonas citronellolis]
MSPLVITALVVAGIVILIAIVFINQQLENRKLEKAREKADLQDRFRRCGAIAESLPGQFISADLKLLLSRFELGLGERLLKLEKTPQVAERVAELRQLVGQGSAIPVRNAPQLILTEAKAKEVRFLFEGLHAQITRFAQDGELPRNDAQRWLKEIRHLLTQLHIEFFTNIGQQALQQGQARQARLAFERGVQYLQKQPDLGRYQAQLQQMEQQLNRANALVLETSAPSPEEHTELTDGLSALETDDIWKKKNLYD